MILIFETLIILLALQSANKRLVEKITEEKNDLLDIISNRDDTISKLQGNDITYTRIYIFT